MPMTQTPWDQRIAMVCVKPLAQTRITPNQVTLLTLIMALAGAGLFAHGDPAWADWGAALFVLARFGDHFDGELARQTGQTSKFGYYFDYAVGGISYGALFLGIGFGLSHGPLGSWAMMLGAAGCATAITCMFLNLDIDKAQDGGAETGEACGYPAIAGFELEDGIYLLAPLTWFGLLVPFFIAAGIGSVVYLTWTLCTLLRLRRRKSASQ